MSVTVQHIYQCSAPQADQDASPCIDELLFDIKEIVRAFLKGSGIDLSSRKMPTKAELHDSVYREVMAWYVDGDSQKLLEQAVKSGCDLATTSYGNTSPDHQRFTALYTACFLYIDDLGDRHLDAIAHFARRFAMGEDQPLPALVSLTNLMKRAYELWTQVGADAIISGTLDAVTAMYVEYTTRDVETKPAATWWPYYFRTRSGICPPFAHTLFMKSWRSTPESYMHLLPYLEFYIVAVNDVLSFYKEQLVGETKNYIHVRASAEQTAPIDVLRKLANEVLDSARTVELLVAGDQELRDIWRSFFEGVMVFHFNTPRYRLAELVLSEPLTIHMG